LGDLSGIAREITHDTAVTRSPPGRNGRALASAPRSDPGPERRLPIARPPVFFSAFLASATAAAAAAAIPAAARADGSDPAYPGSVLHVSVGKPRIAGRVLTIRGTGRNAPDSLGVHIGYGLDVILVDVRRLPG
jgi:hypothetical protein